MERLEDELKVERELERERQTKGEEMDVDPLNIGALERREDVERMWGRGTHGLVELGKIPGISAKLERAGKAVEVVEGI